MRYIAEKNNLCKSLAKGININNKCQSFYLWRWKHWCSESYCGYARMWGELALIVFITRLFRGREVPNLIHCMLTFPVLWLSTCVSSWHQVLLYSTKIITFWASMMPAIVLSTVGRRSNNSYRWSNGCILSYFFASSMEYKCSSVELIVDQK